MKLHSEAMAPRPLAASLAMPVIASVFAFGLDLMTPRGYADGFFYVIPVVTCIWVPRAKAVFAVASAMTLLIVLGDHLSPPSVVPESARLTNRISSAALVWSIAVILWLWSRFTMLNKDEH